MMLGPVGSLIASPEFYRAKKETLSLEGNNLKGMIPSEIGEMVSLGK